MRERFVLVPDRAGLRFPTPDQTAIYHITPSISFARETQIKTCAARRGEPRNDRSSTCACTGESVALRQGGLNSQSEVVAVLSVGFDFHVGSELDGARSA